MKGDKINIKTIVIVVFAVSFIATTIYAKNTKSDNKDKGLPPGLHKKDERGKPLPPGWQKKLSKGDILDDSIYTRGKVVVPLGDDGTISIEVEGTILKLHEKTRRILDIIN